MVIFSSIFALAVSANTAHAGAISPSTHITYNRGVSQLLLQTKLYVPPPRPNCVHRPRLVKTLNAGMDGQLTLISAPAGFGKTTLVSEWLSQLPAESHVAWLSLDGGDDDPSRFLSYLVGALQAIDPSIGQHLVSGSPVPLESAVGMLINDMASASQSFILALDDYHLITTAGIHQAMAYLIDHTPRQLQLVIISRSDLPFSLSRLRARRQLTEVRARDLRFTLAESADFLNQTMGLALTEEEVALLEGRTEGWIAGLGLAAYSLRLQEDKTSFVTLFAGDDRYIADYLLEEVLAHQPETIKAFLLQTSLLERLCAPLCDALLERQDSQSVLEFLESSNLFVVPLDNRRQWYRYHHLFADLLRERLAVSVELKNRLHRRASHWYAENGFPAQAIDHAISATDYEEALDLILLSAVELFNGNRFSTLTHWWRQIPDAVKEQNPSAYMMAAWAWLAFGQWEESERCLQAVEQALGASTQALLTASETLSVAVRNGLIEVAVIRVSRQSVAPSDAGEILSFCQRILPFLVAGDQPHLFNPPIALRSVVQFNMGLAHQALGDLIRPKVALRESIATAEMTAQPSDCRPGSDDWP